MQIKAGWAGLAGMICGFTLLDVKGALLIFSNRGSVSSESLLHLNFVHTYLNCATM